MSQISYGVADSNIIDKVFDDELTLINLANGKYFTAGGAALDFWELAKDGLSRDAIVKALCARYSAPEETVRTEVQRLAELFIGNELIVVRPGPGTDDNTPAPANVKAWRAGWLEVYGDMKDLLLLDPIHDVEQEWPEPRKD